MPTAVQPNVSRENELNSLSILTVTVVLATVTMTFGAIIAIFFIRSLHTAFWGHIHLPGVLWATTCLLLASSVVLEVARRRLMLRDTGGFFRLTAIATVLGLLFLAGQIWAWAQILDSGVVLAQNPHSWFIFLFTGLHGLHIVAGLSGLIVLLFRTRRPVGGPKYQMNTRVVANGVSIFWHYLDFIWVVLFGLLIFWKS